MRRVIWFAPLTGVLCTPTALGLATWGGLYVMLSLGEFTLAQTELDSVTVPTTSPESMQLAGMLALSRSFLAAAVGLPGDVAAPLEMATELAERTGQGNACCAVVTIVNHDR